MFPRILLALHQPLVNTGKDQITKRHASSKVAIGHNAVSPLQGFSKFISRGREYNLWSRFNVWKQI